MIFGSSVWIISRTIIISRSFFAAENGIISYFGWLSNIPLNMRTTSSFSFYNSGDILVASVSWLLETAAKKAGCTYLFQLLFDLDVRPSVGMLDHSVSASWGFQETSMLGPRVTVGHLHSQPCRRGLLFCRPSPALTVDFLMMAILVDGRW